MNRLEVVVHSRVLPGCEVASAFGCSPPVLPLCSPNTWPFRYSLPSPSPKTRLFGPSSPVVRFSYTVFPEVPAPDLSIEGTSPGVLVPLQRLWATRVHVLPGFPVRLPDDFSPGIHQQVPPRQLRCRSQVFPTSQRFLPLEAFLPFSDRLHSWGSSLQGFAPSTKPRRLVVAGLPS